MMAIKIKDGDGTEKYLQSSGAGSSGDPYIPGHSLSGDLPDLAAMTPGSLGGVTVGNNTPLTIVAASASRRKVIITHCTDTPVYLALGEDDDEAAALMTDLFTWKLWLNGQTLELGPDLAPNAISAVADGANKTVGVVELT